MMTLADYLAMGEEPKSLAASAMGADLVDHAMAGAVLIFRDLAEKEDARGNVLDGLLLRRAATWLQGEAERHRAVSDELIRRSGYGAALVELLRDRRRAMVATHESAAPLYAAVGRYLRLGLGRARVEEAEERLSMAKALLATGRPDDLQAAAALLGMTTEATNAG